MILSGTLPYRSFRVLCYFHSDRFLSSLVHTKRPNVADEPHTPARESGLRVSAPSACYAAGAPSVRSTSSLSLSVLGRPQRPEPQTAAAPLRGSATLR